MTIALYSEYSPDPGSGKETDEEKINVPTMQTFMHGKMITKFEITTGEANTTQARIFLGDGSLIVIGVAPTEHCYISFTQKAKNHGAEVSSLDRERLQR
jgi:hypothetical protein